MAGPEVVILGSDGTTEHVFPAGFDPKRAAAIVRSKEGGTAPSTPAEASGPAPFNPPRMANQAQDAAVSAMAFGLPADAVKGFAKGAARTVLAAGDLVRRNTPGLREASPLVSDEAMHQAQEATTYRNPMQQAGGIAETVAELALPVGKAAEVAGEVIPTTAKAGAKFQEVMGAARHLPVDVTEPGKVALRIQELAERGGSMPMAVRKFLNRVTDPDKGDLVYQEARDFASNISRLSANEFQRLTPTVQREVANLRVALNRAVADTAGKAGKGAEYAQAMNEYAKAMKIRGIVDSAIDGAKRGIPYLTAGGIGYWLTQHLKGLLPDE